jgi:ligand-binding sensor domain-containing protein/signal transduction histidine kinase
MFPALVFCLAFFYSATAEEIPYAENPLEEYALTQFSFAGLSLSDGLSQSTVYQTFQDSNGFIWIGTRDGLNRYDGYRFLHFNSGTSGEQRLSNPRIRALTEDDYNRLWVGTDGGGIDLIDLHTHEVTPVEDLKGENVLSLTARDSLSVVAATRSSGLFSIHTQTLAAEPYFPEISEAGTIWTLHQTHFGLMAGTDRGLWLLRQHHPPKIILKDQTIKSISDDGEHHIWAGTDNDGLYHIELNLSDDESQPSMFTVGHKLGDRQILALYPDAFGNLWIGTGSDGVYYLNPDSGRRAHFTENRLKPQSIADNSIRSISSDHTGMVWIGTNNGGISTYSHFRQKFLHPRPQDLQHESFCTDVVLGFAEDQQGNLWIGSQREGICIRDAETGTYRQIRSEDEAEYPLPADDIITLLNDSQNRMWIGTDYGGLSLHLDDNGGFQTFTHSSDDSSTISDNTVLSLHEDSDGALWVGTFRGLNRFDPETGQFLRINQNLHDSLPSSRSRILSITEDQQHIWVGTHSDGIYRIDRDLTAENFTSSPDSRFVLSTDYVVSLKQTDEEIIWAGTDNGLHKLHLSDETTTVFTTEDGLPNNMIYGIVPDDQQYLWLSTNRGISRFSPDDDSFLNFSVDDGLQSNEFNGGAYYRSRNGYVYFGGVNGYNEFNPNRIPQNLAAPRLTFTSAEVNRKPVQLPESGELRLAHDQNFITLSFSALDFTAPSSNLYRYRLSGLEQEWSDPQSEPNARYTSLPPGSYTFELTGSNADHIWAEEPLQLAIIISPPFWQTLWFRLMMLAGITLFLFSAYRYRVHHLLREERTRVKIAQDLHDEVSSTLNSISFFAEAIQNKRLNEDQSNRFLKLIAKSSGEAKHKINTIVWMIRPEHDQWSEIFLQMKRLTADLFDSREIEYSLETNGTPHRNPDLNTRQNIWLIYRELITNISKHAEAGHVSIRFEYSLKQLVLTVSDDGTGFDPETEHNAGNGVRNIKSRVRELKGEWQLESAPGQGTTWIITLPF